MKIVVPQVFVIGESRIIPDEFQAMLTAMGVGDWQSDADSDTELIMESAGKLCYMSFDAKLNKNLTKTGTRDNFTYLQEGIIGTKHGSVLEHCTVNLVFLDVSRVFTHELVRHRPGAAYSQTSGRFVRTDDLGFFLPQVIRDNADLAEIFDEEIAHQEEVQKKLVKVARMDGMTGKMDFSLKKKLTSAFRRLIGNGQSNNIMATYNHRALRHLIEARTSQHAEEEIRYGFNVVFDKVSSRYPALYADAQREMVDGYWQVTFKHSKV